MKQQDYDTRVDDQYMQRTFDGREVPHADVVAETQRGARRQPPRGWQSRPGGAREDAKNAASHAEKGTR